MKILITGAGGFIGKNLTAALQNIKAGYDKTHPELNIEEIYTFDLDTPREQLAEYCAGADFVFHLAGVNRPKDASGFSGNAEISAELLNALETCGNNCPVMLSSSVQAKLTGRYAGSGYGKSKLSAEELFFAHGAKTGADVLVYRFPNVFGKWSRPNYNSAVATFCYNIARGLPITVSDPGVVLELLYIDDLVAELLGALSGQAHRDGGFCRAPITHTAALGELTAMLYSFKNAGNPPVLPDIPAGSLCGKLYSTYLSFLPPENAALVLEPKRDARGSFTELLKTKSCGQFSVNVSKPGVTKGQHWHSSKWEIFTVVSGHGLIRQRGIGSEEIYETEVSGENPTAVYLLPGYTHSIVNLSQTQELITLMWANENFDPKRPDTYHEDV